MMQMDVVVTVEGEKQTGFERAEGVGERGARENALTSFRCKRRARWEPWL